MNTLYHGDNLDILRRHVADESVDLVYLDPPFNSGRSYEAFDDKWRWNAQSEDAYRSIMQGGNEKVCSIMQAFRQAFGENDMLAYLAMMVPRLVELRRVLKATGSLYLHCDPTMSHYLKVLLDGIFGRKNYHTEIVWKRAFSHNDAKRGSGRVHDTILFYSKSKDWT